MANRLQQVFFSGFSQRAFRSSQSLGVEVQEYTHCDSSPSRLLLRLSHLSPFRHPVIMATTRYLVVVYVVTSGLHGDDLGSDEEEVILFAWLVVDITNCKVSPALVCSCLLHHVTDACLYKDQKGILFESCNVVVASAWSSSRQELKSFGQRSFVTSFSSVLV